MLELKEVLLRWLAGEPKKGIARYLGLARNTVRRYIDAAVAEGLTAGEGARALTDGRLGAIAVRVRAMTPRTRGDAWAACEAWTPDQRFLIGQVGPDEGLFVAAGDSGIGFLQAPMVAKAISALVRREDFAYDLERYSPLREVAA